METLKLGSRSPEVGIVQKFLHLYPDNIFGPLTKEAEIQYQKERGIQPYDGIVGPKTWRAMQAEMDASQSSAFGIPIKHSSRRIDEIIVHCTATIEGRKTTVDEIRKWHKAQGWSDIGYHYVVYLDGTVHTGRDVNLSGAHCTNHNSHSIGVVYVGGCGKSVNVAKDTRTPEQKRALIKLVRTLMDEYRLGLTQVHCHNEYANKACPSFKIADFRAELRGGW